MPTPSAPARCCSSPSFGSRLPFSIRLSWLGAVPTAALRSSSVRPACLRRCRTRRPSAITSSSAVGADDGGCKTSLFQLEGDISEEYVKKRNSFQPLSLESGLEVQKSRCHEGKPLRKPAGPATAQGRSARNQNPGMARELTRRQI